MMNAVLASRRSLFGCKRWSGQMTALMENDGRDHVFRHARVVEDRVDRDALSADVRAPETQGSASTTGARAAPGDRDVAREPR